jgi:hypothetical protein
MATSSINQTSTGGEPVAARFEYVDANHVYASLVAGGTIAFEEWPGGSLRPVAKRLEDRTGALPIEVDDDLGEPMDRASVHPDECNRVALTGRAIAALEDARDALLARGDVDFADRLSGQTPEAQS